MAEEPIRKEDIIDEVAIIAAIQALLDKLKELGIGIENLKKIAAGMGDGLKNANPATPEGQAAIKEYSDGLKDVAEKTKILSDIEKELIRRSEELAKQTGLSNKEFSAQSKSLASAQKAFTGTKKEVDYAVGSLTDLRKKLNELEKAYANADPSKAGKMLDGIKKMRTEVDKAETAIGKHQRNVGNYGATIKQLGTKFLAFTGITVGVQSAIKFVGDAMASTGESGDKLEMMTEGVKQGFDAIKRAVVNLDFKDFIKNVKAAYEEGRRYAEGLDSVDEKTRALQVAEADTNKQILENLKKSRSQKYSKDEQIAAGKEIVRLEEVLAGIRTGIAQQSFDNEITNIVQITGLNDKEVMALLRMDDAMMKNIATGKRYNEFLKLQKLAQEQLSGSKVAGGQLASKETQQRLIDLGKEFVNVNDEVKRFAFAANNLATDDKMQILTDKYVALKGAEVSALQGTMRVQTQIDAKEEAIGNKKIKSVESIARVAVEKIKGVNDVNIQGTTETSAQLIVIKKKEVQQTQAMDDANSAYLKELNKDVFREKMESTQQYLEFASDAINILSTITEQNKQRELSAAGSNAEAREKIEREYFKKQKKLSIAQAIINGALSLTNMLATIPGAPINPLYWVGVGISAAMVAAQIAIIAAQKFAEGGEIFGKSHAQGGTMIEAERGEYVVKKQSTSKYKSLIEAINDDNPMRIAEEIRNRNFHTVWGGVSAQLSTVSKQDPYTRMMYELMKNDIKTYMDSNGDTVLSYPDGTKRVIRKYTA